MKVSERSPARFACQRVAPGCGIVCGSTDFCLRVDSRSVDSHDR